MDDDYSDDQGEFGEDFNEENFDDVEIDEEEDLA